MESLKQRTMNKMYFPFFVHHNKLFKIRKVYFGLTLGNPIDMAKFPH